MAKSSKKCFEPLTRSNWNLLSEPNDSALASDRDPLSFEAAATQERAGADEGAGGEILDEVGAVNLVELFVQGEVGTKNLHRDEVVHRHVGFLQSRLHSVEQEVDFFLELDGWFAGFGIDADPSRQIESI